MSLKRAERAKANFSHALSIVLPDRMMTILAVHYRLLHGLLELCMRQEHPLEYKYTIELACDFNKGRVDVKHGLHDEKFTQWLTVMEHSVAMLAVRGWKSQEMASFFGFPCIRSSITLRRCTAAWASQIAAGCERCLRSKLPF
jgi:hypothetical protein